MATMQLCWLNYMVEPATTISALAFSGNMPPQHLKDPRPGKRFRGPVDGWGQGDFGGDVEADVFVLRFPRDVALPQGTVRHLLDAHGGTAGAGAAGDSGAIALGLAEGYGYHVWRPDDPVTLRTWRFQYAASGVPALDTGYAWAGKLWTPKINFAYDPGDQWFDWSASQHAPVSGSKFSSERPRQKRFAFAFTHMDEADAATILDMKRIVGTTRPLLCLIDPDDTARKTLIGTLKEVSPNRHPALSTHSSVFEIEESI